MSFDPTAAGTRTATITLTHDAPDNAPYNFDVQGSAAYAECVPSPDNLDNDITCDSATPIEDVEAMGGNDTITITAQTTLELGAVGDGDGAGNKYAGAGGADIITNNGTVTTDILGDFATGNGGNDSITNNGSVAGNMLGDNVDGAGAGDDITNNGTVDGDINGEGGDDTVTVKFGSTVGGSILGGEAGETAGDTIIFTDVTPAEESAITAACPDPDTGCTINEGGFTYTVAEFETLAFPLPPVAITVSGNGVVIADGDTTPSTTDDTDFGNVLVGSGLVAHTFTIENTGASQNLTVTDVAISGADAAFFSENFTGPVVIAPGTTSTFDVSFDPSAAGARTATITLTHDAPDNAPYNFDVQGSAAYAECVPTPDNLDNDITCDSATPIEDVEAMGGNDTITITAQTTLELDAIGDGDGAGNKYAGDGGVDSITNNGTVTQNIYGDFATGNGGNDSITNNGSVVGNMLGDNVDGTGAGDDITNNGTVDGDINGEGGDDTVTVKFGSTVGGSILGGEADETTGDTIIFTDVTPAEQSAIAAACPDPDTGCTINEGGFTYTVAEFENLGFPLSPVAITVSGNGVVIADGDTTPDAADDTDFGNVLVGSGLVAHTFTIENTGASQNLTVADVTISGADAAFFSENFTGPVVIAPGTTNTFDVSFDPSAAGTRTATITLTHDAPDNAPYNFDVQGSAAYAECVPTPDNLDNDITCDSATPIEDVEAMGGNDTITITAQTTISNEATGDGDGSDGYFAGDGGVDIITNNGTVTQNIYGDFATGNGGNDSITNNGSVAVDIAGDGIVGTGNGGNDTIINTGTIGSNVAGIVGDIADGDGGHDVITNSGSMAGGILGDVVDGSGGNDTITNDGTLKDIYGEGNTTAGGADLVINNAIMHGYIVGDDAISGGNDTIINEGSIEFGIVGDNAITGGDDNITNNGTVGEDIIGDITYVDINQNGGDGGSDSITNNGSVVGNILGDDAEGAGAGDDITNNGTVDGDINGEGGDDTVTVKFGSTVGGSILGGEAGETAGDTIIFTDVTPAEESAITAACPDPDTGCTINEGGFTYTLAEFETLDFPLPPVAITVSGNGVVIADGDTTPDAADDTDFGNVLVGSGLVAHTFTIENTGASQNLTVTDVAISGADAAFFSENFSGPVVIVPGNTSTFDVSFDPSAAGTRTATVTLTHDAPDNAPYNFDVQAAPHTQNVCHHQITWTTTSPATARRRLRMSKRWVVTTRLPSRFRRPSPMRQRAMAMARMGRSWAMVARTSSPTMVR